MGMKPRNQPPTAWEWYRNRVAEEWAALCSSAPVSKPYLVLRLIDCTAVTGPILVVTRICVDSLAMLASTPTTPGAVRVVASWLIVPPHMAKKPYAKGFEKRARTDDLGSNSDPAKLYPGPWSNARAQRRASEADQPTKGD